MNDFNLSDREQVMFNTLKRRNITSIDHLIADLKKAKVKPRLRGGSRSLTVCIRYLGFKIGPHGYSIERISNLGRGNKAEYKLHRSRRVR